MKSFVGAVLLSALAASVSGRTLLDAAIPGCEAYPAKELLGNRAGLLSCTDLVGQSEPTCPSACASSLSVIDITCAVALVTYADQAGIIDAPVDTITAALPQIYTLCGVTTDSPSPVVESPSPVVESPSPVVEVPAPAPGPESDAPVPAPAPTPSAW